MRARVLILACALACSKQPLGIDATAGVSYSTDADAGIPINVRTEPRAKVWAADDKRVTDDKGEATLTISRVAIPSGTHALVVHVQTKDGRTGETTVDVKREPIAPSLILGMGAKNDPWVPACGGDFCRGQVRVDPDGRVALIASAGPGCTVKIAGKDAKLATDAPTYVDVSDVALDLRGPDDVHIGPIADHDKLPLSVGVEASCVDGLLSGVLKLNIIAIDRVLAGAFARAPLTPGSTRKSAIVFGKYTAYWFGPPSVVRDVDVVVTSEPQKRTIQGRCGPYTRASGGGGSYYADADVEDLKLTAKDRHTGAILGTKTLPGKLECPDYLNTTSAGARLGETVSAEVDYSDIEAYVRPLLR